jgi:hypothetical protein
MTVQVRDHPGAVRDARLLAGADKLNEEIHLKPGGTGTGSIGSIVVALLICGQRARLCQVTMSSCVVR